MCNNVSFLLRTNHKKSNRTTTFIDNFKHTVFYPGLHSHSQVLVASLHSNLVKTLCFFKQSF